MSQFSVTPSSRSRWPFRGLSPLAALGALAIAALYALGCAAAWQLSRRAVAVAGLPLNFKRLGSAAVIGVGSMLLSIALADRAEIIGLAAVVVLSASVYLVQARLRERAAAPLTVEVIARESRTAAD